jgi:hypothetical protein
MSPKAAPRAGRAKKSAKKTAKAAKSTKAAAAKRAPTKRATAKARGRTMSSDHKAALALGRNEGRAVRVYLEALETQRPRRGRKRTPESVRRRLATVDAQLASADPLRRLRLMQEQMDLQSELDAMSAKVDLSALERDFVNAAKGYSERKGISYAAWRAIGVSPAVLKRAGIGRGS